MSLTILVTLRHKLHCLMPETNIVVGVYAVKPTIPYNAVVLKRMSHTAQL